MNSLIIASNRLPIEIQTNGEVLTTTGGLTRGLNWIHKHFPSVWVGWPGAPSEELSKEQKEKLDRTLETQHYCPIDLTEVEIKLFYEDFSNGVLWPLFHYLLDRLPLKMNGWEKYVEVNSKFADAIQSRYKEGDFIWIHDYHLCLVPAMLRERLPSARIGFFLHIPFPSSEVFRVLPWRSEILRGICGADLIGFHTFSYTQHFSNSLLRILGIECRVNRFTYAGRDIRFGPFPMGVEEEMFSLPNSDIETKDFIDQIHNENAGKKILLAVDRLDYTKGISRRLLAFERMLEKEPSLREKSILIQIAVPTRTSVPAYQVFRREVDELVGRINGKFGTPGYQPIHYISKSCTQSELLSLYRATDGMVVTPLRDGMNLVAKEFIASRLDNDGVLVLSEFAGAASELGEALIVNPYDIEQTADALKASLFMSESEKRARMIALRERIAQFSSKIWAQTFLKALGAATPIRFRRRTLNITPEGLVQSVDQQYMELVLDYDGTLVPFRPRPSLAIPDETLMEILEKLLGCAGLGIHIVSGRKKEDLDKWFSHLRINLYAEHGFWIRLAGDDQWRRALTEDSIQMGWKEVIRPILDQYTRQTPGSFIEEKSISMVWHYRMCDAALAARNVNELRFQLSTALANQPSEVISGSKVLEVRLRGVNKGLVIQKLLTKPILVFGDDKTDEDMFRALPAAAIGVKVGQGPSLAKFCVRDYTEVRNFLTLLVQNRTQRSSENMKEVVNGSRYYRQLPV